MMANVIMKKILHLPVDQKWRPDDVAILSQIGFNEWLRIVLQKKQKKKIFKWR